MISKSGIVREIDFSHGTILFHDNIHDQYFTCTWSGKLNLNEGDFIVAQGPNIESFEDASSYGPDSAILKSISRMQAVIPINTIG